MHLKSYEGTTVVGFPTKPTICELGEGQWVVTAAEATPEDQYEFLRLLEKYWISGLDTLNGGPPTRQATRSATRQVFPVKVSFEDFLATLMDGQFSIRCCSVMPQADTSAYEYQRSSLSPRRSSRRSPPRSKQPSHERGRQLRAH